MVCELRMKSIDNVHIRRPEIRANVPLFSRGSKKSESVAMASNQCEFQSEAEKAYLVLISRNNCDARKREKKRERE